MKRTIAAALAMLWLLAGAGTTALAFDTSDDPQPRCPVNPACTLVAEPISGAIAIDGRLDEADWQTAPIASSFKQYEPNEGAEASQKTDVRIIYGGSAVYISAVLYDEEPGQIMRTLGRRDDS